MILTILHLASWCHDVHLWRIFFVSLFFLLINLTYYISWDAPRPRVQSSPTGWHEPFFCGRVTNLPSFATKPNHDLQAFCWGNFVEETFWRCLVGPPNFGSPRNDNAWSVQHRKEQDAATDYSIHGAEDPAFYNVIPVLSHYIIYIYINLWSLVTFVTHMSFLGGFISSWTWKNWLQYCSSSNKDSSVWRETNW